MADVYVGKGQKYRFKMVVTDTLYYRFTEAIMENGRQRLQGRNRRWPYIQILF